MSITAGELSNHKLFNGVTGEPLESEAGVLQLVALGLVEFTGGEDAGENWGITLTEAGHILAYLVANDIKLGIIDEPEPPESS